MSSSSGRVLMGICSMAPPSSVAAAGASCEIWTACSRPNGHTAVRALATTAPSTVGHAPSSCPCASRAIAGTYRYGRYRRRDALGAMSSRLKSRRSASQASRNPPSAGASCFVSSMCSAGRAAHAFHTSAAPCSAATRTMVAAPSEYSGKLSAMMALGSAALVSSASSLRTAAGST